MASVQVHHLEKKGPHSKFFDSEAAKHTRDIYAEQFGPGSEIVTKRCVREMDVKYLIRISDEHGHTVAATMLRESEHMHYRICGLAVAAGHQRKGLGSMLLRRIEAILPNHSTVELGVDLGKATTEWLQAWYVRFGFERVGANAIEVVMVKRIERQAD